MSRQLPKPRPDFNLAQRDARDDGSPAGGIIVALTMSLVVAAVFAIAILCSTGALR